MYPDIGQCKSPGKSKSMQKVDDLNRERKEECSHPVWNRNAGMPRYLGCDRTLTLRYHKACNQIFPCFDLGRVKAMYKPSHTTKINKQTNKQNQNQTEYLFHLKNIKIANLIQRLRKTRINTACAIFLVTGSHIVFYRVLL